MIFNIDYIQLIDKFTVNEKGSVINNSFDSIVYIMDDRYRKYTKECLIHHKEL